LQHAQHVAERKKVWVAMHPETKHGGNEAERDKKTGQLKGKKKRKPKDDKLSSFGDDQAAEALVKETARATQTAPRTVERSAQIGENLCRKAQTLLAGTPVEDRKTDLPRSEAGQAREQASLWRGRTSERGADG